MSEVTILVVDDQPVMLNLIEAILASRSYEVVALTDAAKALEVAAEHGKRLRLLITDVRMARMSGAALADAVQEHCPNVRVLFMSGASAEDADLDMSGSRDFIAKPFSSVELRQRVEALLSE